MLETAAKVRYTAVVVVPLLWVLFVVAALAAVVMGIPAALLGKLFARASWVEWSERNVHAADKATAAFLGWSGERTVSKECSESGCRFCRVLCRALSLLLQKDHCARER